MFLQIDNNFNNKSFIVYDFFIGTFNFCQIHFELQSICIQTLNPAIIKGYFLQLFWLSCFFFVRFQQFSYHFVEKIDQV